jgi:hypothetical protein
MLECEARYWLASYKKIKKHKRRWWNERKDSIRKKRGEAGLQLLVDEMNKQNGT